MTKRLYPWQQDSWYQLKSHIGIREVANGCNGDYYTRCIQDRTKDLLKDGAKRFYSKPAEKKLEMSENVSLDPSQSTLTDYFQSMSKIPNR